LAREIDIFDSLNLKAFCMMAKGLDEEEDEQVVAPDWAADEFLQSCFSKTLRVYTSDGRIFVGTFKCTDNVSLLSYLISDLSLSEMQYHFGFNQRMEV
jgi:hypothetical protein